MSDPRLAPTLEEANSGRAFARKWERRFQFAKHGPALTRRWPKPGTPSVGVVGGGAGIATSNPGVGGTAAIVTGILALLQEYAADSDWDNRHRYHQLQAAGVREHRRGDRAANRQERGDPQPTDQSVERPSRDAEELDLRGRKHVGDQAFGRAVIAQAKIACSAVSFGLPLTPVCT
jgi:hypothetical protein